MPKGESEIDKDEVIISQKIISKYFPVKAMFLGVVGRLITHIGFDKKVLFERVSEKLWLVNWQHPITLVMMWL